MIGRIVGVRKTTFGWEIALEFRKPYTVDKFCRNWFLLSEDYAAFARRNMGKIIRLENGVATGYFPDSVIDESPEMDRVLESGKRAIALCRALRDSTTRAQELRILVDMCTLADECEGVES